MISIQDKEILITTTITGVTIAVVVVVIKIFNQNQFDLTWSHGYLDLNQDKLTSWLHLSDSINA